MNPPGRLVLPAGPAEAERVSPQINFMRRISPYSLSVAAAVWMAAITVHAAPRVVPASGPLKVVLKEALDHPFYSWPRTLLSYPVEFEGGLAPGERLVLVDGSGTALPYQISEPKMESGRMRSATVSWFSSLDSGETKSFELRRGPGREFPMGIRETKEGQSLVLDTGVMKVRIPASQKIAGEAPGPVMQVSRGGAWMGDSRIVSPGFRVEEITAERVESGPLFATYQVAYRLSPKGSYTATLRLLAGCDYFEFRESVEGVEASAGAYLEMTWTGLSPTHRQAPNHPYIPGSKLVAGQGYEAYPWERMDFAQLNTHIGVMPGNSPSGELPFRLGLYQPWPAFIVGTYAAFWNEKTNDAVGVFIDKVGTWRDGEYSIWSSSTKLQVRYFYKNGQLSWRWPLAEGGRSTCIAAYDHQKDKDAMAERERMRAGMKDKGGVTYRAELSPASYAGYLQNRHGVLDLNEYKDWVLEYPDSARRPSTVLGGTDEAKVSDLERRVLQSNLIVELPAGGTRENSGFGPVPSRQIEHSWVPPFHRHWSELTPQARRRLTAAFLLMAYTHAGEDYMPMRPMLSGHPNFLSDVKSVPAVMSFLFPEHPMAHVWADEFEKYLELNSHYHTRPDVPQWNALGGRWTENIGTYVWGFVRPAIRANYALHEFDGKNRFALAETSQLGRWLVGALTAPFEGEDPEMLNVKPWSHHMAGMVRREEGPRRIYPPQGAHAERRMPPRAMWHLGTLLQRFDPLMSEALMWASRPTDDDSELPRDYKEPWAGLYPGPDNRGTNPHLHSEKYTGYGLVLRAAVDTPRELSIHLQQIDDGPNYRWGVAAEGGNGSIYFYAGGKAYSHNGKEDVGDRNAQDTDFGTNFGVWKDGSYRSIGRNVLTRPLYDLGSAQYAELLPRTGAGSYATPEYVSRTLMLVGSDYFVTYDDVYNQAIRHRFSWFTGKHDELPLVEFVRGGGKDSERTTLETRVSKGFWLDGVGDSMAVVSQHKDLSVEPRPYGCRVRSARATDEVFRDPEGVHFEGDGSVFDGTAGVVRHLADGTHEMALMSGSRIGTQGVVLRSDTKDLGISARFREPGDVRGQYLARVEARLVVSGGRGTFYVDGAAVPVNSGVVVLPAGEHSWQWTDGTPTPLAPRIQRTESVPGGARVFVKPVASATGYRVELSRDNGATWTAMQGTTLTGLNAGVKVHVRAIALNGQKQSEPGPEYPVYVTGKAPLPPDGLKVRGASGAVTVQWGEVLGVTEYRLYRRARGQAEFQRIYAGTGRSYTDRGASGEQIYEYAVSAVDGLGEGPRAGGADTDPASWRNWDPRPGEPFRRRAAEFPASTIDLYYPMP